MREMDLQLFWLNNSVEWKNFKTISGEEITVLNPGELNRNQGPDFLHAELIIEQTKWIGSVEIHCRSSEWFTHRHHIDPFYKNVILHVVWKYDSIEFDHCPILELSTYFKNKPEIESNRLDDFGLKLYHKTNWSLNDLEEIGLQRMERKSNEFLIELKYLKGNWDKLLWNKLFYAFGLHINKKSFDVLFQSVSKLFDYPNLLNEYHLRCLLLGQASLFTFMDEGEINTYERLRTLLNIQAIDIQLRKFRMRPSSFPERRIIQFVSIFFNIKLTIRDVLNQDECSTRKLHALNKQLGLSQYNKIVINTFVPILLAYSKHKRDIHYRIKAINWISSIRPEINFLITEFKKNHIHPSNALQTQGIIELHFNGRL